MEKLSSIIPANGRTRAVDVSRSQPVRPGAPTYGRPVGRAKFSSGESEEPVAAEVADRVSLSSELATGQGTDPMTYTRPKVDPKAEAKDNKAQVISQLADKFFNTTPKSVPVEKETEAAVEA